MKIHIVFETFHTGRAVVYGVYSSKEKAKNAVNFLVESCVKEGWKYDGVLNLYTGHFEHRLSFSELDKNTVIYTIETHEVC